MEEKILQEIKDELKNDILPYWEKHAKDEKSEGFFGKIDNQNKANAKEWRSIVMVSRFLWSYSAASRLLKDKSKLEMADYAYHYMIKYFRDPYYGGMYWSVTSEGKPLVARKQIYGDAFAVYALSEYAAALKEVRRENTPSLLAMEQALSVYHLMEQYALDKTAGGYFEALAQDWSRTKDTKLSDKDMDCDKSMNTNLHVMEAWTNLYRNLPVVMPENKKDLKELGTSLAALVRIHTSKILNTKDWHLDLFFNKNWKRIGKDEISYGHDIEASWLIWEAAGVLKNKALQKEVKEAVVKVAETALNEGFDSETGGFENTLLDGERDTTRVWWNQAEALNGFYNAWEITEDQKYYDAAVKVWNWIKQYQVDSKNGDWFASVTKEGKPVLKELKGGNWKTSYHNARCCMEIISRNR